VWCIIGLWLWPLTASRLVEAAWLTAAIGGGAVIFWTVSALLGAPERIALVRLRPGRTGGRADGAP